MSRDAAITTFFRNHDTAWTPVSQIVVEFMNRFPGKCIVCCYQNYLWGEKGIALQPLPHTCKEVTVVE